MKYNLLGNTGLLVSELCLGTMNFGGNHGGAFAKMGKVPQDEATKLVKAAFDGGINFIDTANAYSLGESEQMLGQALKSTGIGRDEVVLATKVRGQMGEGPNQSGLSRYHVFNALDQSLQRLQVDHLDVYYVHGEDAYTPVEELMATLDAVVRSGKVRYVGVCNWPAFRLMQAQAVAERHGGAKFSALQYFYSAACRDIEGDIMAVARELHLPLMPWSPLAGGFLSGKYTRDAAKDKAGDSRRATFDFPIIDKEKAYNIVDVMRGIAGRQHVSVAEVALAWVRLQPGVTSTIIGARNVAQLQTNLASVALTLTRDDLHAIDAVSKRPVLYPEWMVEFQASGRTADARK